MAFFQDFKKFISRGNVIDMAVGVMLGASLTQVVNALVNHVLMPPLSIIAGGIDFTRFTITLQKTTEMRSAITMDLGLFIQALLNFFVIGFAVFLLVKILHRFYAKGSIFTKKSCPQCHMEIPIAAIRCGYCTTLLEK